MLRRCRGTRELLASIWPDSDPAFRLGRIWRRKDIAEGQRLGVEATPTFFLGTFDPATGIMKATVTLKGAQPYAEFRDALKKLISR